MFVYPSDEFYIVAGRKIPSAPSYDGFPQLENGVGLVRSFLSRSRRQAARFPGKVGSRRKLTLATGELAAGFMREEILPRLEDIANLTVDLEVVPNVLYGRSVTVAGLLSGKCLYSALQGRDCGDLLLLPPDIVNADGALLDDTTIPQLELQLNVPIMVFAGSWGAVLHTLQKTRRNDRTRTLLPAVDRHSQPA